MEEKIVVRDGRVKEKFMVDDAYLNGYAKVCGIYATGVYMELCRRADKAQKCWPSIARIAVDLGVSVTSVKIGIKNLKKWNIISTHLNKKKRGGFLNVYTLIDKSHWSPHD